MLLALGVCMPVLRLTQFWLFSNDVTILGGALTLARGGEWALAAIIFIFAVLVPGLKLAALGALWYVLPPASPAGRRLARALDHVGRWAMLDVFVIALLVFVIKLRGLGHVTVMPGFYLFCGAALLSIALGGFIERRVNAPA